MAMHIRYQFRLAIEFVHDVAVLLCCKGLLMQKYYFY